MLTCHTLIDTSTTQLLLSITIPLTYQFLSLTSNIYGSSSKEFMYSILASSSPKLRNQSLHYKLSLQRLPLNTYIKNQFSRERITRNLNRSNPNRRQPFRLMFAMLLII